MLKRLCFSLLTLLIVLNKPLVADEGFVNNNGIEIFYRDIGKEHDQAIVFVHGFPFSGEMFRCQIEDLKLYFRIVTIDLRGFGKSSKNAAPTAYTYNDFISDIDAVVSKLGLETFALAAHSMGAIAAENYTIAFPQKVSNLILISPFAGQILNIGGYMLGLEPSFAAPLVAGLEAGETVATDAAFVNAGITETCGEVEEIKAFLNSLAAQAPNDVQLNFVLAQGPNGIPAQLDAGLITQPTLIIYGGQDILFGAVTNPNGGNLAGVEHLRNVLPNSILYELPGGHFITETQSKRISRAMFSFLIGSPIICHTCFD